MCKALSQVITCVCRPHFEDWWNRSFRRTGQLRLIDGILNEHSVLQDRTIGGESGKPYDYKCNKPGYIFTGISCLPVNREIPSPNAEVIEGGINCSSVKIPLTPVVTGEWACRVVVYGRPCTTGPSAEVWEQVHSVLCVTCCTPFVSILDTFVVEVSSAIYERGKWEMCNISLMKLQFVVPTQFVKLRFPHYQTVGLHTHTPSVRMSYPHKSCCSLYFHKHITCLGGGLLRM